MLYQALPESCDNPPPHTRRVTWPLCSLPSLRGRGTGIFLDQGQHAVGVTVSDQQGAALWGPCLLALLGDRVEKTPLECPPDDLNLYPCLSERLGKALTT